jgi:hypothetical protein
MHLSMGSCCFSALLNMVGSSLKPTCMPAQHHVSTATGCAQHKAVRARGKVAHHPMPAEAMQDSQHRS